MSEASRVGGNEFSRVKGISVFSLASQVKYQGLDYFWIMMHIPPHALKRCTKVCLVSSIVESLAMVKFAVVADSFAGLKGTLI